MAAIKCWKCNRFTPSEHGECLSCGASLPRDYASIPATPSSGRPPAQSKTSEFTAGIFIIAILWGGYYLITGGESPARLKEPETLTRKQVIEQQFSAWNGAHLPMQRLVKAAMNDPDSYEHVRTTYLDEGETILVQTSFRGRNAFGGLVLDSASARFTTDGDLVEIVEE